MPKIAVAAQEAPAPDQHTGGEQDTVESLGPLGPFLFVLAFAAAEMIPLAPTQPLSLASGLAFGAFKVRFYLALAQCVLSDSPYS